MKGEIALRKISHIRHVLQIFEDGVCVYHKDLPTKDFLKHDLLHIAIHYYGTKTLFNPETEDMKIEFLAGTLHNIYDKDITPNQYFLALKDYYKNMSKRAPKFLTEAFLDQVQRFVIKYLFAYKGIKTGKTLVISLKN